MKINNLIGKMKKVSSGTYTANGEEYLRLVPVDRNYEKKKSPVYYLQKIRNSKAEYVTGLFKTQNQNVFSGDIKDSLGVKMYLRVEALNDGEMLEITKASRPIK